MFNFTTQTVFNNIVKSEITAAGQHPAKDSNLIVNTIDGVDRPSLRIGNTRFNAELIEKIYVMAPTEESYTSVTFDMSDITFGENEKEAVCRIILYLGLSMNSQDSLYANPFVYKGKPLYVEFKAFKGNATKTAKEFERVVNKFMLLETDEKLLTVGVSGTKITISGVNGYQQLKKAVLQKFNPEAIQVDCCTFLGAFEDIKVGVPVVWKISTSDNDKGKAVAVKSGDDFQKLDEDGTKVVLEDNEVPILPGLEAFGDYNWIIHNLRLPTYENMNFWTSNKEEMPQAGQKYTQFTVTMKDSRDRVAGEGVGMRITSVTTHVFYVAGDFNDNNSSAKVVYDALNSLVTGTDKLKVNTNAQPYGA